MHSSNLVLLLVLLLASCMSSVQGTPMQSRQAACLHICVCICMRELEARGGKRKTKLFLWILVVSDRNTSMHLLNCLLILV